MHISPKSTVLWWSRNCRRTNSCRSRISFADKYFETNAVTLTYFGDGAARQGSLHEAFNMAMLWKLPVVLSLKITVTRWELL
jgi:pyruvate dehydrogenase E1 component alpha subunit